LLASPRVVGFNFQFPAMIDRRRLLLVKESSYQILSFSVDRKWCKRGAMLRWNVNAPVPAAESIVAKTPATAKRFPVWNIMVESQLTVIMSGRFAPSAIGLSTWQMKRSGCWEMTYSRIPEMRKNYVEKMVHIPHNMHLNPTHC
jgi:hypothetical protein